MKTTRALTLLLALALLGFVSLALSAPTAHAQSPTIVRVKVDGATSGTCGDTWANACGLQYALTSAVAPAELWVAAGTYTPTTGTDRTVTFQLRPGFALYGGFAMTETLRTQRNFAANVTILSGDIGMAGDTSDNAYHVVTGSGTDSSAILDGFTVTAGKANTASGAYSLGGGMHNYYGSPTVTNVTFSGNSARNAGAGMYNYYSHPTLTNVTFSSNWADDAAGGMFVERGNPTLTNVTFAGNTANGQGGGGMVNHNYSYPTLTNVTFSGNSAHLYGGGMYNLDHSSPALTNITFSSNDAIYGGGIYNVDASNPTLANVTFSGNTAPQGGGMHNHGSSPLLTNVTFSGNSAGAGGGMYNYSSGPTIRNAIFWGNTADPGSQIFNSGGTVIIYDTVVQGGYPGGTRIIAADPLLGALGGWGGSTQTIPLLPGSSAIDAGDDTTCVPSDQRGSIRYGAHCDMGAFEARGFTLTTTGGDNQTTLLNTAFATPLGVDVSSAYGDPVNGGTVTFTAPSSGASANPITNAVTITSGVASQTMTANGLPGPYAATANSAGATAPAIFALANTKADTTTALTSSANPSVRGQSVTFTATVSGMSPSGSVILKDGGATLAGCDAVALSGGSAQCSLPSPALGTHDILATYGGDATNASSSGTLAQVVNKANTTTVMTSSENPVLAGHSVTFTVTVRAVPPASGTSTGSVSLYETTWPSSGARGTQRTLASQPLVGGVATFALSGLTPGAHSLLAMYGGNADYSVSTSAIYTQNAFLLHYYFPFIPATGE